LAAVNRYNIMASATGNNSLAVEQVGEDEPLLGSPGDASQKEGYPLYYNLILGTFSSFTIKPVSY
jgi:hypothetical protein